MVPCNQKRKNNRSGEGLPAQGNTQVCMSAPVLQDGVGEAGATASYASFFSCTIIEATSSQGLGFGIPICSQNPWGVFPPLTAIGPSQISGFIQSSSRQEVEGQNHSDTNLPDILRHVFLNDKLNKLVPFLLRKYQKKQQVTMEEMMHIVDEDYREHFSLIFRDFCECMCLGFGIDVREIYPLSRTYVLVPLLGLTYNGLLNDDDDDNFPQISVLIVILTIIFIKGNRASEEDIAEVLRIRRMLAQKDNISIGEPWKFITVDLVREQYLEYQQIPNSHPPRYEFLWGPRAHAETSKMKLLEHLARLHRKDPRSYPVLYDEAFREEQSMARAPEWAMWMPGPWNVPIPPR